MDKITWKSCEKSSDCTTTDAENLCIEEQCEIIVDGYYVEIFISLIYGIAWMKIYYSIIKKLQTYPKEDWYVLSKKELKCEELKIMNRK